MKFHAVLLYINDQFPDISIFRKLQEVGRGLYPKGTYLYSVEQELIAGRFIGCIFNMITQNCIQTRSLTQRTTL